MCRRPSFGDLSPREQVRFGNGVGPYWLRPALRVFVTGIASWFFVSACWRHHDFGYAVGGDRWDRARCDWKFFRAMLSDSLNQPGVAGLLLAWPAIILSLLFFAAVRVGGGLGSFEFRDEYASLEEVRNTYR